MRTMSPVTGAEGSDGTTDHAGRTRIRIANGEMGARIDGTPAARIGRPHNSNGPPGRTAQQAVTQAPAHIGRELQTHPAGTGMNRFRSKSNRQLSRITITRLRAPGGASGSGAGASPAPQPSPAGSGGIGFLTERGNVRTLSAADAGLFSVPAGFAKATP